MSNYIHLAIIFLLFSVIVYSIPQSIEKSFGSTDAMIMQHKMSLAEK